MKTFVVTKQNNYFFLFYLLSLLLINRVNSQTFTVKGNISTTDSIPVKYALVTFVDMSDTLKQYAAVTDTMGNYQLSVVTAMHDVPSSIPQSFELMQNYPNPFSEETNIPYIILNEVSNASVTIYNILGQEVKSFKALEQASGMYGVIWDGRDAFGKKVSTGVYIYQLLSKGETQVKKMIFTVGGGTNAKLTGGVFSFQELKKGRMEQTASGMFIVQITNTESTHPKILSFESSNVIVQQDTTLDFKIEEAELWQLLGLEKEVAVTAIATDPTDPNIIYAGTMYDFSAGIEGKLFKSTDAGKTWDTLLVGGSYHEILIDPLNHNIIYTLPSSILKSEDGGKTWRSIINGIYLDPETRVECLAMNPQNPNVLYAGTGGFFTGNFYISHDGGLHWNKTPTDKLIDGVLSITVDPIDTNIIYAGTLGSGVLWKSTNAGESWFQTGLREQGVYDILVDPQVSTTIYAGVSKLGIYKTVDGGNNWEKISQGLPDACSGIKIQRSNSSRLFLIGSSRYGGGIYEYSLPQKLWIRIGIDNLNLGYYYSDLKISLDSSNLYFGGIGIYVMKLKR